MHASMSWDESSGRRAFAEIPMKPGKSDVCMKTLEFNLIDSELLWKDRIRQGKKKNDGSRELLT